MDPNVEQIKGQERKRMTFNLPYFLCLVPRGEKESA